MNVADTRLHAQLLELARHLRDPAHYPAPANVEPRRLAIYHELLSGNLLRLLGSAFPVCRRLLGEDAWQARVRVFQANHACHTPLFARIPAEFVAHLQMPLPDDPPWLAELAHYEEIELALQTADDEAPAHDPAGDAFTGLPVLSPWARALAYRWPVQRLGAGPLPAMPPEQPTLLLVWRNRTGEVRFSLTSALTSALAFRLLELLAGDPTLTGAAALMQLSTEAGASDTVAFIAGGRKLLRQLRDDDVILGTRLS